ncbi:thiamine phosphate synthase [Rhodobacteraceae bacterium RKSG542]|uniref:thiamine phosphate synthase n=1 Tax=Pseudovibrio flavus TaxID=2529854 RepID=UPI003529967C|nr:thiamine phosphate synthase [Pseudovibrio flavus]
MHPRLFLITPSSLELETFEAQLEDALSGGDVASLLISVPEVTEPELQKIAKSLVPLAHKHDVAVLIENNTQIAGRSGADGVHVTGSDAVLEEVMDSFQGDKIIGHSGVKSRHEAMTVASMGVDYIMFGLLDLKPKAEASRKTIDYSTWWAEVFETPCVALSGSSMQSVEDCAATNAEFVAVRDIIWQHSEGPKAAIAEVNAILSRYDLPEAED